jgi:hypothetical protein
MGLSPRSKLRLAELASKHFNKAPDPVIMKQNPTAKKTPYKIQEGFA